MEDHEQYDNVGHFARVRRTLSEKMADFGLSEATYIDFFEEHLHEIINYINPEVFIDILRASRYLSQCDCEEITSPFRNATRRERARKFCDILMTKGFDAFKKFLELLEYEYPHVFLKITDTPARNPPQGYERHTDARLSQNLAELSQVGFKISNLNNQKNNLSYQLEELQKMLEFVQNEKVDLEREISFLKPYAAQNADLQSKLEEADKEIRNLKDENREFMKKIITYRDTVDRKTSRIEQLLIDRDELEKKLKEATNDLERMNQSQDVLIERFEEERKKSQRLINIARRERVPAKCPVDAEKQQARNVADFSTKIEILQYDLEAEQEKVRELCATLDVTEADLKNERQASENLRREKLKLQRESDQTQLFLKHAERKNDTYFKTIQELEKEKRKAEEEKILAQQKCWDISDQKQRLFEAQHNLEQKFDHLRQRYERLRQSIRNPIPDTPEAADGDDSKRSKLSSPPIRPRASPLLARSPVNFEGLHFTFEREISSSGSDDAQRDTDVFALSQELLSTNSPYASWFEGHDVSVEESHKEGEDSVEKLNMKNLYVRSNLTWEDKTLEDTVPIREGEFLYIADTTKLNFFQVNKVEPMSGYRMRRAASGLVPDFELAKLFMRRSSQGAATSEIQGSCRSPFVRRDAIRNRDCPYTVIAPLKAVQKLPVLLHGHPTIVEAILDVLENEAKEWAMIVRKPVLINQRQNWREMCNLLYHTVMPAHGINHQSDRDQHRYIVINVKLMGDDCQEQLKVIFGHDFEDIQSEKAVAPSRWALHSETLVLPAKITDRSSLMSQLKEKITKVQNNIFWMTISWKTVNSLRPSC